jgi:hypothetical protein
VSTPPEADANLMSCILRQTTHVSVCCKPRAEVGWGVVVHRVASVG